MSQLSHPGTPKGEPPQICFITLSHWAVNENPHTKFLGRARMLTGEGEREDCREKGERALVREMQTSFCGQTELASVVPVDMCGGVFRRHSTQRVLQTFSGQELGTLQSHTGTGVLQDNKGSHTKCRPAPAEKPWWRDSVVQALWSLPHSQRYKGVSECFLTQGVQGRTEHLLVSPVLAS